VTSKVLVVCEGCGRHVRAHVRACPFCGVLVVRATERARLKRLSRGAVLAAIAVSACHSAHDAPDANQPTITVYGGPPAPTDAAAPRPIDAGTD
jgi:predicted RNA-binding Zn-ribbon protein involved in translation (DUF1610 family)